jgi:glycosyltransferase involved in cell wall biosynthesis
MKLLVSAYACAPNRGSEHAVGWAWVTEAYRLGHEIWVLASSAHRSSIELACRTTAELAGIRWIFPEVRGWPLRQGDEPKWERTYNLLWQRAAADRARELLAKNDIDAIHHITWAGIRAPTFLGGLGPPLIIGPIGGGETTPAMLRTELGMRGRLLERVRNLSNATIGLNPIVGPGLQNAAMIFVSTEDTQALLARTLRRKTIVFSQVGLPNLPVVRPRAPRSGPPRFVYAGRLLYWKGVHIALGAFAEIVKHAPGARFTIVGDGPERDRLGAQVETLSLHDHVDFIPRLPQQKLFEVFDSHDLMLFPSLHDSGGFVVLEALSRGLPVVCLDLGGPKDIVTPESGIVVETRGRNTQSVAAAMAEEIFRLLTTPERLPALSAGAIERAQNFLSHKRITEFYRRVAEFGIGAREEDSSISTATSDAASEIRARGLAVDS